MNWRPNTSGLDNWKHLAMPLGCSTWSPQQPRFKRRKKVYYKCGKHQKYDTHTHIQINTCIYIYTSHKWNLLVSNPSKKETCQQKTLFTAQPSSIIWCLSISFESLWQFKSSCIIASNSWKSITSELWELDVNLCSHAAIVFFGMF